MRNPRLSGRGELAEQVKGRQGKCSHLWCQHLSAHEWAFDLCIFFFFSSLVRAPLKVVPTVTSRRQSPVSRTYWQWFMVGCQQTAAKIMQQNPEIVTRAMTQVVKMWSGVNGWLSQHGHWVGFPRVATFLTYIHSVFFVLSALFEEGFAKDALFLALTQYSAEG